MRKIKSEIKNSKIFITGGAGFIGTSLAKILSENNQIILFDNLHNNALSRTTLRQKPNIKFVKGDVLDTNSLISAMDDDVNYVIHCAAIAGVDTVINNPILTLQVNIQGIFNVFQAAINLPELKRIVDFSTSEIYGHIADKVGENEISPSFKIGEARWAYAISKLSGEIIAQAYNLRKNIPTVSIRPFNIYGPNQVGIGAIHNFVVRALKGDPLFVHNDGKQVRSWCYIDDFVQGVLLSMEKNIAIGKSYNIGNPESTTSVFDLAKTIQNISGSSSEIKFKKVDYQDILIRIPKIDLAQNDLKYEPLISLPDGLKKTIEWYSNGYNPQ